jgi:integral membrane protein
MQNLFRIIAFLEGVSYILLLFIAVPLKYWGGDEQYVKLLGMPHGVLFVAYIFLAYFIKEDKKWGVKDFGIVLLASIFPFGTFYVDWKYLKKSRKN